MPKFTDWLVPKNGKVNLIDRSAIGSTQQEVLGLFKHSRLVIPETFHQEMSKSKDFCRRCPTGAKNKYQLTQPLIISAMPEYPLQRVATVVFEWQNNSYLLLVDCYSIIIEIAVLTSISSPAVISHRKPIFTRYRMPAELNTDIKQQFSANDFIEFAEVYGFIIRQAVYTSPD